MATKPTVWDHAAHLVLLQAVIENASPTPTEWDGIVQTVAKKGYSYTASAALQHLQKLRRKEGAGAAPKGDKGGDNSAANSDNGEGPSTPPPKAGTKRKTPGSTAKKATPTKGKGKKDKPVVNAFMEHINAKGNIDGPSPFGPEWSDDDELPTNHPDFATQHVPKKRMKKEVIKKEEDDGDAIRVFKKEDPPAGAGAGGSAANGAGDASSPILV